MHCPHQATPTNNGWLATPIPSIRQPEPNLHRMLGEEPRRLKKKDFDEMRSVGARAGHARRP